MGMVKREMERAEARYFMGLDFCLRAGSVEQCENHEGTYFAGDADVEEAYKLANAEISSGKYKLSDGETRRDVTDAIKAAYDDNSAAIECATCDKIFNRD